MSKGDTFENDWLKLVFNATPIANIADNAASAPLTNLYVSLHTADPGEAGTQATSECSYTGYARVAVARTTGGFTVAGNSVSPVAAVVFGQRSDTGAVQTATYFGIGVASSGATKLLYSAAITTPAAGISITQNVTPQLNTTTAITED